MNDLLPDLTEQYAAALQDYLAGTGETALHRAYELGRQAVEHRLPLPDMAAVHQEALSTVLLRAKTPKERARIAKQAGAIFREMLAPFEMTYRGFQEANANLRTLNETLQRQAAELEAAKREVERANDELRKSEAKFRGLVEGSANALVAVNREGLFTLVNAQAEKLFGYGREELLGQPLEMLLPERVREAHRGHRARYVSQPSTRPMGLCMELFARRKDGSQIPVEISLSPAETPEGLLVLAIIIDISARKQAEERLKKHAAELQAVNAELDAFTYSVAHDLRAPLRRIDGFAQLLVEDHSRGLQEEAQHYLGRIREGTRQMGQLVDDLLNLARVGRSDVHRQVVGLGTLVQEVVADLKRETGGRDIEWKLQPLPFVECDPALMKVVFANLLSNAVKYTRPRQQAVVEVGTVEKGGQPVIFVRDNGVGFSMKYADKLFGVFQRLHRQEDFEGTGVGLATVQRIVHKHGGQVWAEGELDKGACFYFTLGTPPHREPEVPSASETESYVGERNGDSFSGG